MLIILLSWIYILAITLVVGTSIAQVLKTEATPPITTILFGCYGMTLLTGFWAIFRAVNEGFYAAHFLITLVLFFMYKKAVLSTLKQFKMLFLNLKPSLKIAFLITTTLLLAKCTTAPFLIDNETYYLQTIKWLNHYGFTKGLTNLHPFLGQTSGWQLLQSGFNFAFIYDKLNDISGFILLLGNMYALTKLNIYLNQKTKNKMNLAIGLFPIFNVFLFQFISAPSPDIAIYVIGIIVFYEFVNCYKQYSKHSFYTVFIVSVFATFIKLTGLVFFVFALILYFRYYIYTRRETTKLTTISLITFVLFVIKNTIITGHPLYPLSLSFLQQDWSLPAHVHQYLLQYETAASYGLNIDSYNNASIFKRLTHWLTQGKLDSVFNSLLVLCIAILAFVFKRFKTAKPIKIIYYTGIGFLVFLFLYAPQYRFYFPFLLFFIVLICAQVIKTKKTIIPLLLVSILLPIVPLFISLNTTALSNTTNHQNTSTFSLDYFIEPHDNSRYKPNAKPFTIGNTTLHNLTNGSDFIWETGNAPLPALSQEQLQYFKTYFNIVPQQYSTNLKDGFYSKKITNE